MLPAMAQAAWQQMRAWLPRSSYTTSMKGLTWRQAFNMPLPPYLSPLPVIFRVMAYAVIAPVLLLLVLDVGGYLIWRAVDQPIWSTSIAGTRTAFYKFRSSPVFVKSRTGSPNLSKDAVSLAPSPPLSPEDRATSLSPVSSSPSLHEDNFGSRAMSEADMLSSPPSPSHYTSQIPVIPGSDEAAVGRLSTLDNSAPKTLDSQLRRRGQRAAFDLNGDTSSEADLKLATVGEARQPLSSGPSIGHSDKVVTASNSLGIDLARDASSQHPGQPVMFVKPTVASSPPASSS